MEYRPSWTMVMDEETGRSSAGLNKFLIEDGGAAA
jgi:hypothetical protein